MNRSRRSVLYALAGGALAAPLGCRSAGDPRLRGRVTAPLWFSYGGKNREVLLDLVGAFHAAQAEYAIKAVYQGDYFEGLAKLRTAIYAKEPPALSHVVGEVVPYLAEANVLETLDTFPGARDLDLVPALAQGRTWRGGAERPLVALPFNRSTPIAYYNRTLFKQAGLAPPTTWDELITVAGALTQRRGSATERWGFECPIDWWFWAALVGQAGGELVGADGSVGLGGEAGLQAVSLWRDMVRARIMKPPPGRDYDAWQTTNTDFLAGKVAMIWNSTAFLRYLEGNASFEVGAAPLPAGVRRAVPTGGTFFILPKGVDPAVQAAAWAFLRFMMAPEQANAWATRTGYMPVSRAGLRLLEDQGYYASHPNDRVAVDQLAYAVPWPWSTELFRVQREIIQPRLESIIVSDADPRAMLDEARRLARIP